MIHTREGWNHSAATGREPIATGIKAEPFVPYCLGMECLLLKVRRAVAVAVATHWPPHWPRRRRPWPAAGQAAPQAAGALPQAAPMGRAHTRAADVQTGAGGSVAHTGICTAQTPPGRGRGRSRRWPRWVQAGLAPPPPCAAASAPAWAAIEPEMVGKFRAGVDPGWGWTQGGGGVDIGQRVFFWAL